MRKTPQRASLCRAWLGAGLAALLVTSFAGSCHGRERLAGDVERIKMIGFTVGDMEREVEFFSKVLRFEKVSDFRVVGSEYDKLQGVFNANMRIVHLQLGEQTIELTQYISPPTGRPVPISSYSIDEWFEHMAIVVTDMDAAYSIPAGAQCPADFRAADHHSPIQCRRCRNQGDQVSRSGTPRSGIDLLPAGQGQCQRGRWRATACSSASTTPR